MMVIILLTMNKNFQEAQWNVPSMTDQGGLSDDLQINFPAFTVAEQKPRG